MFKWNVLCIQSIHDFQKKKKKEASTGYKLDIGCKSGWYCQKEFQRDRRLVKSGCMCMLSVNLLQWKQKYLREDSIPNKKHIIFSHF